MKNIKIILALTPLLLLINCKQESEIPKVSYEKTNKKESKPKVDKTQITIADLPINFEGTNYLIHPVGDLNIYSNTSKNYGSSSSVDLEQDYKISNYSDNQITGYLQNIQFQQIGTDSIRPLSTKPILIETATYLNKLAERTKKQIIIYTLSDSDTNKDGKIDNNDIQSLYCSDASGDNFIKLSTDFQELIDWSVVDARNQLYFRTLEDTNKNGAFDKDDKVHYFVLDLLSKDKKTTEYYPIKP